jgi:hypothetical protein
MAQAHVFADDADYVDRRFQVFDEVHEEVCSRF